MRTNHNMGSDQQVSQVMYPMIFVNARHRLIEILSEKYTNTTSRKLDLKFSKASIFSPHALPKLKDQIREIKIVIQIEVQQTGEGKMIGKNPVNKNHQFHKSPSRLNRHGHGALHEDQNRNKNSSYIPTTQAVTL